VRKDGLTTTLL